MVTWTPVNPQRGELAVSGFDQPITLCLTMAALARLEKQLKVVSLGELCARLPHLSEPEVRLALVALANDAPMPVAHLLADLPFTDAARLLASVLDAAWS